MTEEIKSTPRSFGFIMAGAFSVFALLPLIKGGTPVAWLGIIAAIFGVCAAAVPHILQPLNIAWAKFGFVLHSIMSPLILGMMFFLVFTPMGLLMRGLGKDLLRMRLDKAAPSYWLSHDNTRPPTTTMKEQF
jgi:hypothetical protein